MCPSSARRIYHRVRWVHSASSLPTQQQGIELLFSSQLRITKGSSTRMACVGDESWSNMLLTSVKFCFNFAGVHYSFRAMNT